MFLLLIGGDKKYSWYLLNTFGEYLNKGYTYQDIKTEILTAFYNNKEFRWYYFNKPKNNNVNLLKVNEKYYHKELKLLSDPPMVERDLNHGTIVSRVQEYFLEPVASYTSQDFIQYFYKTMPLDLSSQSPEKLTGILNYKINTYGIDKLLFMTDIYAQKCKEDNTLFVLGKWDDVSTEADYHIAELGKMIPDSEPYYVPKKRRIFDV